MYLFKRIPADSSVFEVVWGFLNSFLELILLNGAFFFVLFLFRGVLFLPSCRPRDEFLFEFIELNFCKGTQIEDPNTISQLLFQQLKRGP